MTGAEPLKRLVCVALPALLALATPASADVSIGRATTGGEQRNYAFIDDSGSGTPGDVAVAGNHVYWVGADAIGRAKLDGSSIDPGLISGLGAVGGLAADDQYVYWGGASIGRARLDGTGVEPNFMTPNGGADDIAVRGPFLYWTSDVGIGRANLNGTGADPDFIDYGVDAGPPPAQSEGVYAPTQVAVNSTHAFWVYSTYHAGSASSDIGRANLDGTGIETVLRGGGVGGDFYGPLGAGDDRVFFRVRSGLDEDQIRSFDADFVSGSGTGCCLPSWQTLSDPDGSDPFGGVAVADGHVFWAHAADGGLHCDLDSTKGKQRQRGGKVSFAVWFAACELITVRASGKVDVAGASYALKPATETRNPSDSSLSLKPTSKDRKPILAALKKGQTARAKIKLQITDTAGNAETVNYKAQLARKAG